MMLETNLQYVKQQIEETQARGGAGLSEAKVWNTMFEKLGGKPIAVNWQDAPDQRGSYQYQLIQYYLILLTEKFEENNLDR